MKRTRNPRFVKQYRDAAGTWINQYRRNGRLIRLPNGRDFNETWWKAYYAAGAEILSGDTLLPAAAARVKVNSIDAALIGYYRSTTFRNLALNTQRNFRHLLERDVRLPIGDLPLAKLGPAMSWTLSPARSSKPVPAVPGCYWERSATLSPTRWRPS